MTDSVYVRHGGKVWKTSCTEILNGGRAKGSKSFVGRGGDGSKNAGKKLELSQRELAQLVGAEYYTFISQLETGRGRIPPDRYQVWAEALNIPPKEFVENVLRFYDPVTYGILFDA